MHRPAFAIVGVGFAAAPYIPNVPVRRRCDPSVGGIDAAGDGLGCMVETQGRDQLIDEHVVLNETIHQSTRLRIMTLLVSPSEVDQFAYGFIQQTLDLTAWNLTTHLRKLEEADYLVITKEFMNSKPRTWVQVTPKGRRAFAEYLSSLENALNWQSRT